MALVRVQHWAERALHTFLLENANKPFKWGTNDCCLWVGDAIQAVTGVDIAADFRGKYTTKAQAFALIKTLTNGTTVADAAAYCAAQHGLPELPKPLFAQRGDLVIAQNGSATGPDSLIAGIVHLNGRHVVTVGPKGLIRLPITTVTRAWRV